jgi:hypothetical protein
MYRRHDPGQKAKALATNPIARAIARARFRNAATTDKVRVYLMNEGDDCTEFCRSVHSTLSVIACAAQMDRRVADDDEDLLAVREGLALCEQMLADGKWQKSKAEDIEAAIDAAAALNDRVSAQAINQAFVKMADRLVV